MRRTAPPAACHSLDLPQRQLSAVLAGLWLTSAQVISVAATVSTPLGVTLLHVDGQATQLLLRMPAGQEPILSWGGTAQPAPYKLALLWPDATVTLERPLPQLAREGADVIQTLTVNEATGQARLDMLINQAVEPRLRRVGDSWVLRLDPVTVNAAAPSRNSVASLAATSPPPAPSSQSIKLKADNILRSIAKATPPDAATPAPLPAPVAPAAPGVVATLTPTPQEAPLPAPLPAQRETPALPPQAPTAPTTWQDTIAPALPPPTRPVTPTSGNRKSVAKDQPEVLLLDVRVNSQRLSDVVRAEQLPGGTVLLPVDAWLEARLAPGEARTMSDGTPAYSLDSVAGATYSVNRQNLSLEINAPASAFIGSRLGLQGQRAAAPPRPDPGLILNYDTSVQRSAGGAVTGGATLEAIAFNKLGNFVSSALVRDDGTKRSVDRLDTFWRYDMPERLETIVVGDTVGVGGGWSRPARYGGFRWGRDFGQAPGFVTLPQLSLNGSAALPSTVEVLVNNARRISQPVQPGPFELNNVPLVTGAGQLNLVVRDLLGRETVVQQSYYASPRLLAPGLTDFSIEGGKLRTGYGQDSHYGDAFGAVTWRQGLTGSLTGEARVEVQANRKAAGVELAGLLGTWGVGRVALATSTGNTQGVQEQGQMLQLGIERSTPHGGGALQYERASQGFEPFGEGKGIAAASLRSRERLLATVGGTLWGSVSGGVNYVSQSQWNGDTVKSVGLSVSTPLWNKASLSFSVNRRIDGDHAWRAGLVVSIPLEDRIYTSARLDTSSSGKTVGAVSAARNAPAGPGLGWRVEGSSEESQRARGGLQYNTSQAEFALDAASDASGKVALRGGARGTLGMLAGVPFASRPVGQGSFAVVEVEGMAGVPVKRSHQVVAETDANGRAFVPGLLPWQKNQIEIDPVDLPLDTEVGETVQQITPYARSGSVVKFAVRRTRQALVVLQQPDGTAVPVGAKVTLLPGGTEFMTGRRGEVWLTDLAAGQQRLRVSWPGGSCELELPLPTDSNAPSKIGPVACGKN